MAVELENLFFKTSIEKGWRASKTQKNTTEYYNSSDFFLQHQTFFYCDAKFSIRKLPFSINCYDSVSLHIFMLLKK